MIRASESDAASDSETVDATQAKTVTTSLRRGGDRQTAWPVTVTVVMARRRGDACARCESSPSIVLVFK
eukprot:37625-Rhodomonas_salina.2